MTYQTTVTSLSKKARKSHSATASFTWEWIMPWTSVGFLRAFMSSTGDVATTRFSSGTWRARNRGNGCRNCVWVSLGVSTRCSAHVNMRRRRHAEIYTETHAYARTYIHRHARPLTHTHTNRHKALIWTGSHGN